MSVPLDVARGLSAVRSRLFYTFMYLACTLNGLRTPFCLEVLPLHHPPFPPSDSHLLQCPRPPCYHCEGRFSLHGENRHIGITNGSFVSIMGLKMGIISGKIPVGAEKLLSVVGQRQAPQGPPEGWGECSVMKRRAFPSLSWGEDRMFLVLHQELLCRGTKGQLNHMGGLRGLWQEGGCRGSAGGTLLPGAGHPRPSHTSRLLLPAPYQLHYILWGTGYSSCS